MASQKESTYKQYIRITGQRKIRQDFGNRMDGLYRSYKKEGMEHGFVQIMKLKKEQDQESGEIIWNFLVQVDDNINNRPYDEVGAEW